MRGLPTTTHLGSCSVGLSLVLAGSLSFFGLPAAAASTDVAAPAAVSSYVPTATPLDVTNASARLTVKVCLSDETGVISGFLARVWKPETDQDYWLSNRNLVSRSLQTGLADHGSSASVRCHRAVDHPVINPFGPLNNRSKGFTDLREVTIISGWPTRP